MAPHAQETHPMTCRSTHKVRLRTSFQLPQSQLPCLIQLMRPSWQPSVQLMRPRKRQGLPRTPHRHGLCFLLPLKDNLFSPKTFLLFVNNVCSRERDADRETLARFPWDALELTRDWNRMAWHIPAQLSHAKQSKDAKRADNGKYAFKTIKNNENYRYNEHIRRQNGLS